MEETLNSLGFSDFRNYNPNEPDDLKRMSLSEIYDDRFITFQIVNNEKEWVVEKIYYDINNSEVLLQNLFDKPYSLIKIIDFLKKIRNAR